MLTDSFAPSLALRVGSQPASPSPAPAADFFSFGFQHLLSGILVIGVEVGLAALVCGTLYGVTRLILSRALATSSAPLETWGATATRRARKRLLAGFFLLVAAVLVYNGWLMVRGLDARAHTAALIRSVEPETRMAIGIAVGQLGLSVVGLLLAIRLLRRLLRSAERAINRWDQLRSNDKSLASLFTGLERAIVNAAWMLLIVFASGWFGMPEAATGTLLLIVRIYLVIAIGILFIRCTTVSVDTLSGLSERSARKRGWLHYYDRLRPLLPTLRACLEYALWIGMGSLVLLQIDAIRDLAGWGPRLIQAIGIFFAGRVIIELGSLEIGRRMLPPEGLEEADRRRRETMVPLVRSAFTYAAYFATAVLMLSALGFNPMPFLAGAGILGLVIGFGAQSLIDDVVSGFFILLENTYLVGDTIEVGNAAGIVEAIEFRTTKIRDSDGRLHVIRNADVKPVINYSKDYTIAVVAVEVAYDADLPAVFNTLRGAGERLRADNRDVLADMTIDGITAFGGQTMTVRTSTRVKPGRHESVAAALRLLLKETFDRQAAGAPRSTLIPQTQREGQPAAGV